MFSSIDRMIRRAGRAVVVAALLGMMVLLAVGILVRIFPIIPLAGYDEIVELLMAWMTFVGAAVVWGEGTLYRVDVLVNRLGPRATRFLDFGIGVVTLVFATVLTMEGWRVAVLSAETTPFLRFPKSISYASMPVAGVIMTGYAVVGLGRTLLDRRRS